ncbi:UDP-glucose dehydrogenase family protein [Pseudohongiella sp.]|uniref:UDP-glucose 6-dehydrogenase n=1 Tax=marine sediment metagenome TaxID=412755 RepID=A0A0F9WDU1_9ZZZZ|nr:UDP-glucose/GDP-mannose dehydrogenase family protein [Pseudohongiella sp.]HDZ09835.1 UDP-glucose/GDP-mannose dehydrogenase family protein [Pseudohongiella sp.]HEA61551.1 UDP-glucose/GDP-mannose dehydrogenase family protein [Pseudohongiella sp.]
MKVTIFGTGYVGLVSGTCLADSGHQVMCMDVDADKIAKLRQGVIPIYEPGLETLVMENSKLGNLLFTSDAAEAVNFADLIFIAVGTPPDDDGSADLKYVLAVASEVGRLMSGSKTIITKSTVPVGTSGKVREAAQAQLDARGSALQVDVASNPEFLKEGAAINDFMKPDRIIVGTDSARVRKQMTELYAPFNRNSDRMIVMDIRAAELTKYAANAMLATKISFMNEIANLAELLGADIEQVRHGIGSDPRIGYQFIYPGIGYGGSCFPKDVQALERTGREHGMQMNILQAVEAVNNRQKQRLVDLIGQHYPGGVKGKTFAIWGLSFKPKTDDMREAPSRVIMEALWQAGANIQAYDPEAMQEVERLYGQRSDLRLAGTRDAALVGADALIVCTEWQHFRAANFEWLAETLTDKVIFDGRNVYDPTTVSDAGLTYYAIGRGASLHR